MRSTDRLVTVFLVLVVIMLVGMLTASWRVVLYPYLVVIGVVILLGVGTRRNRDKVLVGYAVAVTAVYIALYIWLELTMRQAPDESTDLVVGLVPSTAIYFFAIWPFGLVVAACYALFHQRIMSDGGPDETGPPGVSSADATTGDHS